ncbi:hypothetical protein ASPZODRAFT_127187 [Penicilliopsis zonata CBS 506.65]|uniref:Uncharacterized protein n=1 Tax=Penicilliopsis zonata CBS 506.65 TaxID=1073090 RepID=A0A1L9SVA7_9EURO|nr:hypothetical protein ASPZODRAFT_127187 [Penicilliopsis zonata CBS 506.65]OJJ51162.1 hypothetical protein ASPZODRAFT_127187 [Penicilliopsis zonata CBS 506.65]
MHTEYGVVHTPCRISGTFLVLSKDLARDVCLGKGMGWHTRHELDNLPRVWFQ